jgi:epoxyqueuosine reductase
MSPDTSELTKTIKEYATKDIPWIHAGADLVGFVSVASINEIEPYWVEYYDAYTMKPTDYMEEGRSVIVLGYHAWDDLCEAFTFKGDRFEAFGYARTYHGSERLARYIEKKGYKATVAAGLPMKQLARLAGFGSYGKNSLIINPKYGPWIRLNAVLTDAILDYDEPFTDDLCEGCESCVEACPTGALVPYKVDHSLCLASLHDEEWLRLFSGTSSFEDVRAVENGDTLFKEHSPMLTDNTYLLCMACQRACPHGREERGL